MARQLIGNIKDSQPKSTVERLAEAAPVVGGMVGGTTGAMVGGTAGSIVPGAGTAAGGILGGGIGTTIGTAAGGAVENIIKTLAGKQDKKPEEQLMEVGKESATAGAIDVATAGLLHGAGKVVKPVLQTIARGVENIPLKSVRVNPSQLTNWTKKHQQDLAKWMVEKKILGENSIDLAAKQASILQSQFDNMAMNGNITIPLSDLRVRFAEEIADLAGATLQGGKTKITPAFNKGIAKKVLQEWDNILTQARQMGVENVTPKMLTEFRRNIDEVIPKSQFIDPSVNNIAVRTRRILNDVIQGGIDKRLLGTKEGLSLKQLGQELSKYYDFLEIARRQENLGKGSLVTNLTRLLSGGGGGTIGALVGGVPGAVVGGTAGLATEAALRSPSVLKGVYQTGKAVEEVLPPLFNKLTPLMRGSVAGGSAAAASELTK